MVQSISCPILRHPCDVTHTKVCRKLCQSSVLLPHRHFPGVLNEYYKIINKFGVYFDNNTKFYSQQTLANIFNQKLSLHFFHLSVDPYVCPYVIITVNYFECLGTIRVWMKTVLRTILYPFALCS